MEVRVDDSRQDQQPCCINRFRGFLGQLTLFCQASDSTISNSDVQVSDPLRGYNLPIQDFDVQHPFPNPLCCYRHRPTNSVGLDDLITRLVSVCESDDIVEHIAHLFLTRAASSATDVWSKNHVVKFGQGVVMW